MRSQRTPLERLLSKLDQSGECWIFTGSTNGVGYGRLAINGKLVSTHALAYTLWVGPIPPGLCVLHRCDTPPCCRPSHLFLGTRADNAADRTAKGRSARGEHNGFAKLTEEMVLKIRSEYATGNSTQELIARRYNICQPDVSLIVRRKTWKHV